MPLILFYSACAVPTLMATGRCRSIEIYINKSFTEKVSPLSQSEPTSISRSPFQVYRFPSSFLNSHSVWITIHHFYHFKFCNSQYCTIDKIATEKAQATSKHMYGYISSQKYSPRKGLIVNGHKIIRIDWYCAFAHIYHSCVSAIISVGDVDGDITNILQLTIMHAFDIWQQSFKNTR